MKKANIIGRTGEYRKLEHCMKSNEAELIVVYGRRRVGKTFLINSFFHESFSFYLTGVCGQPLNIQLFNFITELNTKTHSEHDIPSNWMEAFLLLREYIETLPDKEKQVFFFDEMPWMDTPRSDFIAAFEWFWNSWGCRRNNLIFIACGSATAWMVDNIDRNKGGLFNRATLRLYLRPFNLNETEEFLISKGIEWSKYTIVECYMIMGGIPYYLKQLNPELTFHKNIDSLFFTEKSGLWDEFNHLYQTLFTNSSRYIMIVEALSSKKIGLTRNEIIKATGIPSNGNLTTVLNNLEYSGFIRICNNFGMKKNNVIYQLSDYYTAFYFNFIHNRPGIDQHYWSNALDNPSKRAWGGLTFEQVCYDHIPQIKMKLGISGVLSEVSTWKKKGTDSEKGAQIDLVIARRDNVINLCEIKYSMNEYIITKDYDMLLRNKTEAFRNDTKTKCALHPTMITTYGVKKNKYSSYIAKQISLEDLFKEAEEM